MSDLISIIIPVYNCEAYLQKTLDSIINQTYSNWEAILIDDGSIDNSGVICDSISIIDQRFHVFHQENSGPGEARNTGLNHAQGEYIYFIDGGDFIHPQALEFLYDSLKDGSSLVLLNFQIVDPTETPSSVVVPSPSKERITRDKLVFNMLSKSGVPGIAWAVVWNKMYKKSIIEGIRFSNLFCNEDQDFNFQVYSRIKDACFICDSLYYYVRIPNSIVRDPEKRPKRFYTQVYSRFQMLSYISNYHRCKYMGWSLDFLYRMMLNRRNEMKSTIWYEKLQLLSKIIFRKTLIQYLFNPFINPKYRLKFLVFWPLPGFWEHWVNFRNND